MSEALYPLMPFGKLATHDLVFKMYHETHSCIFHHCEDLFIRFW